MLFGNDLRRCVDKDELYKLVKRNQKLHNPDSPLLIGEVKDSDVVKEVNEPSFIDAQQKLF